MIRQLYRKQRWLLCSVWLTIGLSHAMQTMASYPPFWDKSAYAIECKEASLQEVLQDFSLSFGVLLDMEPTVGGYCQGWMRGEDAVTFLNTLAYKYQFEWYVFRQTLHISPITQNQTIRLKVDPNLKLALRDLGLYQEKFGWGDLDKLEVALISGPTSYITLIKKLLNKTKEEKDDSEDTVESVYVIPVRHASVDDRVARVRKKDIKIPGIATILTNVLSDLSLSQESGDKDQGDTVTQKSSKLLNDLGNGKVSIQPDVRTNSLIIKSPYKEYDRRFFENLVAKLDEVQEMIEIDAIIVDINKETLFELGMKSFESVPDRRFGFEFADSSDSSGATLFLSDPAKFIADLKALEGHGEASIIANTSILTMENLSAVIDLSETVFIRSVGERVANVEEFTTGTLLNVVPQHIVTDNGNKIKLSVEIEDGKFEATSSDLPRIVKSNISTTALIDQDQALVIGGYHVEKKANNESKVPLLGDIPVLGNLFSLKNRKHSQQERIFILTPRLSPTYHRVESYAYFSEGFNLAASLEKIRQRWLKSNQNYVDVFTELVTEYVRFGQLRGVEQRDSSQPVPFQCVKPGLTFHFSNSERFVGEGLDLYLGYVENTSRKAQLVSEKACFGRGLVGVSVIDSRTLPALGGRSRILVALESVQTLSALVATGRP